MNQLAFLPLPWPSPKHAHPPSTVLLRDRTARWPFACVRRPAPWVHGSTGRWRWTLTGPVWPLTCLVHRSTMWNGCHTRQWRRMRRGSLRLTANGVTANKVFVWLLRQGPENSWKLYSCFRCLLALARTAAPLLRLLQREHFVRSMYMDILDRGGHAGTPYIVSYSNLWAFLWLKSQRIQTCPFPGGVMSWFLFRKKSA